MPLPLRVKTRRRATVTFSTFLLTLLAVACSQKAEKVAKVAKVAVNDSARQAVANNAGSAAADTSQNSDTTDDSDTPTLDTSKVTHIDAAAAINAHAPAIERVGKLSPLADSIAATLVFELKTQRDFLAASRAKRKSPLVALAVRADSALPPVVDSCERDSISAELGARLQVVKDSLLTVS